MRHHPVIDGSNAKKSPPRCVKRDAEAAVTNAKKLILFSEKSSLTLSTKNSSVIIPYLYQTNIAEFLVTTTVA
ncbi:hypothetical protein AHY14_003645, partial [Salmonella enterica subsp. enterica serovar Weltevreden]|nr:hypothetical protein [Salmonella enterica subsp. enterica]EGI5538908.1 hypothetical protein [Salmonella enterica subsp. enterica serovar Weltevreden]